MDIRNTASVRIEPTPDLVQGTLTTPDKLRVYAWIERNKDALIDLWNGKDDIADFLSRMVKV